MALLLLYLLNDAYSLIDFFLHFFCCDKEYAYHEDENCSHNRANPDACNGAVIAYEEAVQKYRDSNGKKRSRHVLTAFSIPHFDSISTTPFSLIIHLVHNFVKLFSER